MKGFKEFLLQGNLIELATAVIIATAFGKVVEAFTKIIMDFIGLFGGTPDFSTVTIPGVDINVGIFLTTLVSFVVITAIVYFFIIKPYVALKTRFKKEAEVPVDAPSTDSLLVEIRDLLKTRNV